MVKIVLLYPPAGSLSHPHLGLPSLSGYLRQYGISDINLLDVNLRLGLHLLSANYLDGVAKRLERRLMGMEREKRLPGMFAEEYVSLAKLMPIAGQLISTIEGAVASLRDPKLSEDPALYDSTLVQIRMAFMLISEDWYPNRVWFSGFESQFGHESSRQLLQALKQTDTNPYHKLLQQLVMPDLIELKPDIVGISLCWPSQLLATLTLAQLIRRHLPQTHLVCGGSLLPHLLEPLLRSPRLLKFFDSLLPFDGEIGLLALIEALASDRPDLAQVPGLYYNKAGRFDPSSRPAVQADLNQIPAPDFADLPLDQYLSFAPVLPLASSRGCYYARCRFCDHFHSQVGFRQRKTERVIDDMLALNDRYAVSNFYFVDDCMPPNIFKRLSAELPTTGRQFHWMTEIRFEQSLSEQVLAQASRAGCKMLLFGLESGSDRVLQAMCKGITGDRASRIIADAHRAGIGVWLFFMVGFPTENEAEAAETLEFIKQHRNQVSVIASGPFILTRQSPLYRQPDILGLSLASPKQIKDLQLTSDYSTKIGQDAASARLTLARFRADPELERFLKPFIIESHGLFLDLSYYHWNPPTSSIPKPTELWNLTLRRTKLVGVAQLSFDPVSIERNLGRKQYDKQTCWIVSRPEQQKISSVGPNMADLLLRCDGRLCHQIIAEILQQPENQDLEIEIIIEAITELLTLGYLDCPA